MRTVTPRPSRHLLVVLAAATGLAATAITQADEAFLPTLVTTSTIPASGEVNPYGVCFVPDGFPAGGAVAAGDVLVSNFNGASNLQGTGTTIVSFTPAGAIAPPGSATVFFTSALPGLSTALGALRRGYVLVGNVPTTDGCFATIGAGALQVLDRFGTPVATWTDATYLDGPWDLAIDDWGATAHVFVSNVLNGTVSRLDLAVGGTGVTVTRRTTVAIGFTVAPNAAAVVLGPTGLVYDRDADVLYVASTADNAVYRVAHARTRAAADAHPVRVFSDPHLRGPLALRAAPNGHLLVANGDAVNGDPLHPSELVEFTKAGVFVREYDVDPSQGGAFGFDTRLAPGAPFNFAVVDDVTNSLSVYRLDEGH